MKSWMTIHTRNIHFRRIQTSRIRCRHLERLIEFASLIWADLGVCARGTLYSAIGVTCSFRFV
jgi:hypothetical protein